MGIYSENNLAGSTLVTNDNKIDLSGDQSIGIYTTGENNITNNGTINLTGDTSIGMYTEDFAVGTSTGHVSVGDK